MASFDWTKKPMPETAYDPLWKAFGYGYPPEGSNGFLEPPLMRERASLTMNQTSKWT